MKKVRDLHKAFVTLEEWDAGAPFPHIVVRTSDSVAGLLYDVTSDRVLLIRQQRPAMVRDDNPDGAITEMVAGRFDVKLSPKALLIKEAREEAGVEITEDEVELINRGVPMALSTGVLTERCFGAFAIIRPDKVAKGDEGYGVPEEGEKIARVWMSAEEFVNAQHADWRVWAFAQFLARRRLENQLATKR